MHSKRIPWRTRRHHTAGIRVAGVGFLHALLVAALVALLTVVITLALWPAAGDGVGFGNEAGQAVADRVSQSINLAACSRTAGRRVAGVGFLHASTSAGEKGGNGKLDIEESNPFYLPLLLADEAVSEIPTVEAVPIHRALGAAANDGVWHRNQTGLTSSMAEERGGQPKSFSRVSNYTLTYRQMGFPWWFTSQVVPGPQGLGSHGSGLSTHLWLWQMYPV